MSGHSKWATTKHKKAAIDASAASSSRALSRTSRLPLAPVAVTDRQPTLFDAIQKAKKNSVRRTTSPAPSSAAAARRPVAPTGRPSCTRATVPAGSPSSSSASPTTATGPPPTCAWTFSRNGGNLADPGSVAYNFSRKGVVEIAKADGIDEDTILMAVLDAGAEEVLEGPESFEVISDSSDLIAVRNAVTEAGMEYDSAESQFLAGTKVEVDLDGARKVMRLIDALEDLDDVQNVFTSVDISPEVAAQLDDE